MSLFEPEEPAGPNDPAPMGIAADSGAAVPADTLTVAELHARITQTLTQSIGAVWITGEVHNLKKWGRGWRFFDLVDPQQDDPDGDSAVPSRISVRLSNTARELVNRKVRNADSPLELRDGARLRIRGRLRSWGVRSQIQFEMSDIDVMYTRGVMAQERQRTLRALAAEGLLDANAGLVLADPVLDLALITSSGSAAEADFMEEIRNSPVGFRVSFLDARTQGVNAAATIVAALRTAESLGVQAVVLVRGGGSALDLSAFDGEAIARAVAVCAIPVLTGIGHETDQTVVGQVSHTDFKTPTACGGFLRERAAHWQREVATRSHQLQSSAGGAIARRFSRHSERTREVSVATRRHVRHEEVLLLGRRQRIEQSSTQMLERCTSALAPTGPRTERAALAVLERWNERMANRGALISASSPQRALARGWSITRDQEGEVIRDVESLAPGAAITTEVMDGSFTSVVGEIFETDRRDADQTARGDAARTEESET